MSNPLQAHGYLLAAHSLLQKALAVSPSDIELEIVGLINLVEVEIDHAAEVLQREANRQLAERLGPGFSFGD